MQQIRTQAQEAAEDIFFGQVVMNWARWFVIGAAAVLAMWTASSEDQLVIGIIPVVALMAVNFFLHGRHLTQRPANPLLITAASLIDIAMITLVVLVWSGQTGLHSQFFVFYYPVILAFAFVMPPRMTIAITVTTLTVYALACVLASYDVFFLSTELDGGLDVDSLKKLLVRLITLGAMGGLGTYYWRVQRNRRREATGAGRTVSTVPQGA